MEKLKPVSVRMENQKILVEKERILKQETEKLLIIKKLVVNFTALLILTDIFLKKLLKFTALIMLKLNTHHFLKIL